MFDSLEVKELIIKKYNGLIQEILIITSHAKMAALRNVGRLKELINNNQIFSVGRFR